MADDAAAKAQAEKYDAKVAAGTAKKSTSGFGGSFDMGTHRAKGMDHDPNNKKVGFGGSFDDMGTKDAKGVGKGE